MKRQTALAAFLVPMVGAAAAQSSGFVNPVGGVTNTSNQSVQYQRSAAPDAVVAGGSGAVSWPTGAIPMGCNAFPNDPACKASSPPQSVPPPPPPPPPPPVSPPPPPPPPPPPSAVAQCECHGSYFDGMNYYPSRGAFATRAQCEEANNGAQQCRPEVARFSPGGACYHLTPATLRNPTSNCVVN